MRPDVRLNLLFQMARDEDEHLHVEPLEHILHHVVEYSFPGHSEQWLRNSMGMRSQPCPLPGQRDDHLHLVSPSCLGITISAFSGIP